MAMILNHISQTVKYLLVIGLLISAPLNYVVAEESESLLNFKFNHLSSASNDLSRYGQDARKQLQQAFSQYDATWSYPWETKNVNLDLGVTLRHLSGYQSSKVLPLLHASALFELPLEGLSAGIEGSHIDLSNQQVFDYRAKVSYEWRKGFGLQGGWQHQQSNLNNVLNNGVAGYKKTGPFLDFYLNF